MSAFIKKLWNDHGMLSILIPVIGIFVIYQLNEYLSSKGSSGSEGQTNQTEKAYKNGATPQQVGGPADASEFRNEDWSAVGGAPSQPVTSSAPSNPRDLLPTDTNSEWAKLNPVGSSQSGGELSGINFLKAGYQIGINTVSQSMRNANQQLRSDPVIPQVSTGPWMQSTITNDFMQVPFEIGQGPQ
jgi:hypothetical protein